jgi:uncharacterized protein with gpF-like domain
MLIPLEITISIDREELTKHEYVVVETSYSYREKTKSYPRFLSFSIFQIKEEGSKKIDIETKFNKKDYAVKSMELSQKEKELSTEITFHLVVADYIKTFGPNYRELNIQKVEGSMTENITVAAGDGVTYHKPSGVSSFSILGEEPDKEASDRKERDWENELHNNSDLND